MSRIGIIGGSGLYNIEGIKNIKRVSLNTPFGKPSDSFVVGRLCGKEVVFLPRHGKGHRVSPSEINYRANIYGMKKLGVERIISVTACGSLKEKYRPLDFIAIDQFVDRHFLIEVWFPMFLSRTQSAETYRRYSIKQQAR